MIDTLPCYDTIPVFDTIPVYDTIQIAKYVSSNSISNSNLVLLIANIVVGLGALVSILKFIQETIKKSKNYKDLYDLEVEPDEGVSEENKEETILMNALDIVASEKEDNKNKIIQAFIDSTYKFRTIKGLMKDTKLRKDVVVKMLYDLEYEDFVRRSKSKNRELWTLIKKPSND